jgi:ABC-2 type transport system permease protein
MTAITAIAHDTALVLSRELRPLRRDPFSVIFTMVQPLVFLGLFGPLLDQVVAVEGGGTLQWFVPGIVVMSALFGSSTTGANLQQELVTGSYERLLVTPLHRSALLIGRALKEIVPVIFQATIIVAATIPFGFRLDLGGAVAGLAIVATFAVGLGSLSHALALATRQNEWMFWAVQQTVLFPLLLLSGILLPIDGGPAWLRQLSSLNPLTYVVDAERVAFAGDVASGAVAAGAVAALVMLAAGLAVGLSAVRRDAV